MGNVPTRFFWVAAGFIVLAGFLVYANVLKGQFLLDDEDLVQNNLFIRDAKYLGKAFSSSVLKGAEKPSNFYRPIQTVSYALDYAFWKLNPFGYHLTNILLHIAAALLIFWFLNILFGSALISFIAGLYFAVHPVHTEAVSFISGRADSLAAIFIFLTLIFYVKLLKNYSHGYLFVMLASFVLALLSRENALGLPLLVLVYHFVFQRKLRWAFLGPLLGIEAAYVVLRFTLLRFLFDVQVGASLPLERLPGFFFSLLTYLRLLVLPFGLHMEYGTKFFSFVHPQAFTGAFICLFLLTFAFTGGRKYPLASFAILWFFATLLPSSNIYPINAYMAEHWLYLPSLGFFLILGSGLERLYNRKSTRKLSLFLAASFCVFFSVVTVRHNAYWKDLVSYCKLTLRYVPESSAAYCHLGRTYAKAGRRQEAVEAFEKAVKIGPDRSSTYSSLAQVYSEMGRKQEAVINFEKALNYNQRDAMLWNKLGAAYTETGDLQGAVRAFKKAIELNTRLAGSYYNLALIYRRLGQNAEADEALGKIKEIDPDFKPERVSGRAPD